MPFDFAYWSEKILYDLAGYFTAFVATWIFYRYVFRKEELPNPFGSRTKKWEYYLWVLAGAMLGGTIISTFDGTMIPGRNPVGGILLSKSIAGALF